jgi:hypothetical protein
MEQGFTELNDSTKSEGSKRVKGRPHAARKPHGFTRVKGPLCSIMMINNKEEIVMSHVIVLLAPRLFVGPTPWS